MSQKIIQLPEIGQVTLQKKRGNKNLRISIARDGRVKVSMPSWAPFQTGISFALNKADWIKSHQTNRKLHVFLENDRIGKSHRIRYINESRKTITSRVTKLELIVRLPIDVSPDSLEAQAHVQKSSIRALKQEANTLLPNRVSQLANQHGFNYSSVSIKLLRSRWGSCSSQKEIALNCYLMQLPWDLIDYVILHELMHTQVMAHGKIFWTELDKYVNNLPEKRKLMRKFQPLLMPQI